VLRPQEFDLVVDSAEGATLKALFRDKGADGFKFKVIAAPVKLDIGDEAVPW
jgi:hypothetical protein